MSNSLTRLLLKSSEFSADFETTTDPEDCRVWLWAVCPVVESPTSRDVVTGRSLNDFMVACSTISGVIYFHNLRFDGTFILDWLLNNRYKYSDSYAVKGHFTSLISKDNKFYSIKVVFMNGNSVEFRDSFKKIPLTVERAAQSYKLPISKLHIDYHEYRPEGYIANGDELDYIAADVMIIARILWQQREAGMSKLTVGADSLAEYKNSLGKSRFNKLFPLLDIEIDNAIRRAYRGGWTYLDSRRAKKVQRYGSVYDVNSLYPYVMYSKPLPYGHPERFEGEPDRNRLFIVEVSFTAKLRKGFLPCIQVKNHPVFIATEYLDDIEEVTTLSLTSVDLDLWERHYELDIVSFNGGYYFAESLELFTEYIDKWTAIKAANKGGLREIAKLHLNSLYGKFATNPDVTSRVPVLEDGRVKLKMGDEETRSPVYTAVGCFVTAHARAVTINAAQANYNNFIYSDTDSIHILGENPIGIDIDPIKLGAWKKEYRFDYGMFWRPKTYIERVPDNKCECHFNTHYESHIAGLPRSIAERLTIGDFRDGATFNGKLLPRVVPGGIVLVETEYKLKT